MVLVLIIAIAGLFFGTIFIGFTAFVLIAKRNDNDDSDDAATCLIGIGCLGISAFGTGITELFNYLSGGYNPYVPPAVIGVPSVVAKAVANATIAKTH